MSSNFVGLKRIKENSKVEIVKICETLIKILDSIIQKPNAPEPRRIFLESPDIIDNLMPYSGGLETLFEIGFVEVCFLFVISNKKNMNLNFKKFKEDESFFLPLTVKTDSLSKAKTDLELMLKEAKGEQINKTEPEKKSENLPVPAPSAPSCQIRPAQPVSRPISVNTYKLNTKVKSLNVFNFR